MVRILLISVFIIVTFQSCAIVNATKGQENVCSAHNVKMKKAIVKTQYGNAVPYNDFKSPNAKMKLPMGCVVPTWPSGRLAVIYHCKICDSLNQLNK